MECDDKLMKDKMAKVALGLNLMPVWMTNDLSKVTIEPVAVTFNMLGNQNQISNILHSDNERV